MSAETRSLALTYTPLESGDGESRWLRVEQVETGNAHLTVAEAAELIDSLFDLEPCDDGMGGGGEEADPDKDPDAGKFDSKMAALLREAGLCNRSGGWKTEVDVFRSHKQPANYELRGERVTVEATRPMRGSKRQIVEVSGAVIELEWPYDGGLQGIPEGVKWKVRGSTVNLDRPINGRLVLRYNAWWERVTLNITYVGVVEDRKIDDMIRMLAVSGGASDRALGENKPTAAAVVAFWGDLAAACELEPPEEDPNGADVDVDEVCGEDEDDQEHDWTDTGCWKTIHHYKRCNCSYAKFDEWEEQVPAPCDGASSGAQVGYEEKFGGFGGCEGEEDEVHDPEYYKKRCCRYPTKTLPRCRKSYAIYNGGQKIDGGPEHWRNIYGENVVMVPVLPESGVCGERVTEWNVPQKDCCEGVDPLSPDPDNPVAIRTPGQLYGVEVQGGKDEVEFRWKTSGGIKIRQAGGGTEWSARQRYISVYFEEGACPSPTVTVSDGCSDLTMTFEGPDSDPPALSATDLEVASDRTFSLSVRGGVPTYMWMATGGIELVSYSPDGTNAVFRTPADRGSWCVGEVTVVDSCGREARCSVRNANTGKWFEQDFDQCNPPGSPYPGRVDEEGSGNQNTLPSGGYYARVISVSPGPRQDWPDPTVCGAGNDISNQSAKWEEDCLKKNQSMPQYSWAYNGGVCVGTRKTNPNLKVYQYYSETAVLVWRWNCEGE